MFLAIIEHCKRNQVFSVAIQGTLSLIGHRSYISAPVDVNVSPNTCSEQGFLLKKNNLSLWQAKMQGLLNDDIAVANGGKIPL